MAQIEITLKAFERSLLEKSILQIYKIAQSLEMITTGVLNSPTKRKKFTVIRSPHIDKNSREQFELKSHKAFFNLFLQSTDTKNTHLGRISLFLFLLKNSQFYGVELSFSVNYCSFFGAN